jgi:hypothetical protein
VGIHPKVDFSIYLHPLKKKEKVITFLQNPKISLIFLTKILYYKYQASPTKYSLFFGGGEGVGDRPSAKIHHQKEH